MTTPTTTPTTTVPFDAVCGADASAKLISYGEIAFQTIIASTMDNIAIAKFASAVRAIINRILNEFSLPPVTCVGVSYVNNDFRRIRTRAFTQHLVVSLLVAQSTPDQATLETIGLLLTAKLAANAELSALVSPFLAPGEGYTFAATQLLTSPPSNANNASTSLSGGEIGAIVAVSVILIL